jgi:conjugative transfer signal peptidase TraF
MKRFWILLGGYAAIAAITVPAFVRPAPRLVWNASASVPIGLYAAHPVKSLSRGDLVAAHAPVPVAKLMAERGYLPVRVPMLKQLAALVGQEICRSGTHVLIDRKLVAEARAFDRAGRALPAWQGCHRLADDEVFLLNPAVPDSFDGRYFGPIKRHAIVAILTPLWTHGAVPEPAPGGAARGQSLPEAKTKGAMQ